MMRDTILYVSDQTAGNSSVVSAIEALGDDVVSTRGLNQAMALLFVMQRVGAVVLDLRKTEQASFDFAQKLQAIHPGVPILLRCCEHVDPLPSWVDAYVGPGEPLEKLTSTLRTMLDNWPPIQDPGLCPSRHI